MPNTLASVQRPLASTSWLKALGLCTLSLVALYFLHKYAARYYLNYNPSQFAAYWPRRITLLTHISGGVVALLTGPWQFSARLRKRYLRLHRFMGRTYLIAVAIGGTAALRLAATTTFGWAWGFGVAMLAMAWLITSGMAFYAIQQRQIRVHREWMVRSYVVTFAFVTFRYLIDFQPTRNLRPMQDLILTSIWACWTVPLFAAEVILQLRQMGRAQVATKIRD